MENSDVIIKAMDEGNFTSDSYSLRDVAYAIVLILKHCKLPNWRLASLSSQLIAVFNNMYGYVVNVPAKC